MGSRAVAWRVAPRTSAGDGAHRLVAHLCEPAVSSAVVGAAYHNVAATVAEAQRRDHGDGEKHDVSDGRRTARRDAAKASGSACGGRAARGDERARARADHRDWRREERAHAA